MLSWEALGQGNHVGDRPVVHFPMETPRWQCPHQQDNVPHHTGKTAQEWAEERGKDFKVSTWLLNSPSPNPIEHP